MFAFLSVSIYIYALWSEFCCDSSDAIVTILNGAKWKGGLLLPNGQKIEQTNLEVSELLLRLMVEILHQLIGSLSIFLPGFIMFYTSQVVSRISSTNSSFFT